MSACTICYEPFSAPVSLPCGHVFCKECIRRCVDAKTKSNSGAGELPSCPTCRAPYPILSVDPTLIPPYLRAHFLPPIRPVYIDSPASSSSSKRSTPSSSSLPTPPPTTTSSPVSIISASSPRASSPSPFSKVKESAPTSSPANDPNTLLSALQQSTHTWRRRAETHAAANSTLLAFSRSARDCALRLRSERDAARSECVLLRKRCAELELRAGATLSTTTPDDDGLQSPSPFAARRPHPPPPPGKSGLGLPVFLLQCQKLSMPESTGVLCAGPGLKRRRSSSSCAREGQQEQEGGHLEREGKRARVGVPAITELLV